MKTPTRERARESDLQPTPVRVPKPTPVRAPARPQARPVHVTEPTPVRAPARAPAPVAEPRPARRPPVRVTEPTPVRRTAGDQKPGKARVSIDPRIRQRRIEVKRTEGRRRLKVLIASVSVIGAVAAAVGAVRSPLLNVDHVVLVGGSHTSVDQVVGAASLGHHPSLIDVATGRVERRVRALPWVDTATAVRQWPATVKVAITERTAAASIPSANGQWAVVDGTGRVLELQPTRPDAMPSVTGAAPAGSPGTRIGTHGRDAMAVAAALPPDVRSITVEVAVLPGGDIELHVLGGGIVKLGDTSDLAAKLLSTSTMLGAVQANSWRILDVRVPRAPVLTPR